jgi:hypothetical protein
MIWTGTEKEYLGSSEGGCLCHGATTTGSLPPPPPAARRSNSNTLSLSKSPAFSVSLSLCVSISLSLCQFSQQFRRLSFASWQISRLVRGASGDNSAGPEGAFRHTELILIHLACYTRRGNEVTSRAVFRKNRWPRVSWQSNLMEHSSQSIYPTGVLLFIIIYNSVSIMTLNENNNKGGWLNRIDTVTLLYHVIMLC